MGMSTQQQQSSVAVYPTVFNIISTTCNQYISATFVDICVSLFSHMSNEHL